MAYGKSYSGKKKGYSGTARYSKPAAGSTKSRESKVWRQIRKKKN